MRSWTIDLGSVFKDVNFLSTLIDVVEVWTGDRAWFKDLSCKPL